jgi:hypothetical protein
VGCSKAIKEAKQTRGSFRFIFASAIAGKEGQSDAVPSWLFVAMGPKGAGFAG